MIGSFKTVKPLLDDALDRVPGTPTGRIKLITDAMKLLSDRYEDTRAARAIDFGDPAIQYAYVYKYMSAHANFVFKVLNSYNTTVRRHFLGTDLNIAVIGGGPGSEAVGLAMLEDYYGRESALHCLMYSPQPYWQRTWEKLEPALSQNFTVDLRHIGFDLTAALCDETTNVFEGAELFFFVKVMSEVKDFKPAAERSLASLFTQAKSGSHFIFIDNLDDDVYPWFDGLVRQNFLTVERSEEDPEFRILDGEQKRDLEDHIRDVEGWHQPMMEAQLAIRLAVKP